MSEIKITEICICKQWEFKLFFMFICPSCLSSYLAASIACASPSLSLEEEVAE